MKRVFIITTLCSYLTNASSQSIGIGTITPNASSILDIRSTNKGLLIPRMTTSEVSLISNPAKGLMVYDTVKNQLMINMGSSATPNWQTVVFKSGWSLNGNGGLASTAFIGTTDNIPLNLRVNNQNAGRIDIPEIGNAFFGYQAGNVSGGALNTGIGTLSLHSNTTGEFNVGLGPGTLLGNMTGAQNIAIGLNALSSTVAGNGGIAIGNFAMAYRNNSATPFNNENIAIGNESLQGTDNLSSNTGNGNIAVGNLALRTNSTGGSNNAIGYSALTNNTTGNSNNAFGYRALYSNTTGSSNVASGYSSMHNNTTGSYNTAYGNSALFQNETGTHNTALGNYAMQSSVTGSNNTAVGSYALFANGGAASNTGIGADALKYNSGNFNIAVGIDALSLGNSGFYNSAVGSIALTNNSSGSYNTATGFAAMYSNTTGQYNATCGTYALYHTVSAIYNTAVGYYAGAGFNQGSHNVFVGANASTNIAGLTNVIAMGAGTVVTASNTVRFGNSANVSYGGWAGWTNVSDGRFKKNIEENVPGLDFVNKLRPITYNLAATELDEFLHKHDTSTINASAKQFFSIALNEKEKIRYTGFVAQEVEAVAKALGFDFSGVDPAKNENDTYGLRYAEFVVPLVKAVQELSKQNEGLKKQNDDLLKRIEKLELLMIKQTSN